MSSSTEIFAADLITEHKEALLKFKQQRRTGQFSHNVQTADSSSLYGLVKPHLDSFDWMFEPGGGLSHAVATMPTMRIAAGEGAAAHPQVEFRIKEIKVDMPTSSSNASHQLLPTEARQLGITYDAPLNLQLEYRVGSSSAPWVDFSRPSGRLPIMVRSSRCHLKGMSRAQLVCAKEEAGEWGGYFIMNGNERCVRLLIMPRRNHISTLIRSSFLTRGAEYTKYGTTMRCVRKDHSSITVTAHYLETGGVNLRFVARKQELFLPAVLVLKGLTGATDREIYEKITFSDSSLAFESERTELMLRESKMLGLRSQSEVLAYLGSHFRNMIRADRDLSDAQVGLQLLREYLFIHVQDFDPTASEDAINQAKFDLVILMIQRLLLLVQGKITPDHVDALSSHEVLLPGHMYYLLLKESVHDFLTTLRSNLMRELRLSASARASLGDVAFWRKLSDRVPEIGRKLAYFITTGNLVSRTGLDMMQVSGYTINAEKLNYYRYLSHFRSIHRGQFFTTMKTTAVRKLLPESWGFVCPVHTPDGSPCGLLNHLSAACQILTHPSKVDPRQTTKQLFAIGMRDPFLPALASDLPVMLDGVLVGRVPQLEAASFAARVRFLKVSGHDAFDKHLEIFTVVDYADKMFPAVILSTAAARFQRPVYYLPTAAVPHPVVEYIGAMEQLTMEIAVTAADFSLGLTTHQEINPTAMLSVIASLTPFSDHNQSPRNMYQCLSGDHDVLTNHGWCSIVDVRVGDSVLVADTTTLAHRWEAVTAKLDEPHAGQWYALKSAKVDALCTPEHRFLLSNANAPSMWRYRTVQDALDGKLVGCGGANEQWDHGDHSAERLPVTGHNANPLYTFSDCAWLPEAVRGAEEPNLDFCRLIGLVLGDGGVEHSVDAQGRNCYNTTVQQCAGIEGVLNRLRDVAADTFTYSVSQDAEGKTLYRVANRAMYDFFLPMTVGAVGYDPLSAADVKAYDHAAVYRAVASGAAVDCAAPEGVERGDWQALRRWVHYAWRLRLSRAQARALIEGFMATDKAQPAEGADASVRRGVNSSLPLINDLAALALLADARPQVGVCHKKGAAAGPLGAAAAATCWEITVSAGEAESVAALPRPVLSQYVGRKYCITVPSGNFLTRRRAAWDDEDAVQACGLSPFFTGNCQMGKQTMGTPFHSYPYRVDNKVFRIQNPQTPIVRNEGPYQKYLFDEYPMGCNAVVAVISYTGYDMEDAMIINKSAYERGFGHGSVYKYKVRLY